MSFEDSDSAILLTDPSVLKARIGAKVTIRSKGQKGVELLRSGVVVSIDPVSKR